MEVWALSLHFAAEYFSMTESTLLNFVGLLGFKLSVTSVDSRSYSYLRSIRKKLR